MSNKMALDALKFAEAALADIGDADREPGDDLAWCEARAAEALPQTRAAIAALQAEPQPDARNMSELNEWQAELTALLSELSHRNDAVGMRAEGLGQFLPELREKLAAFSAVSQKG